MDINILYDSVLKMLKNKFNIDTYDYQKFQKIFNDIIIENQNDDPREINKKVLIYIRDNINIKENTDNIIDNDSLSKKIKEIEYIRNNNIIIPSSPISTTTTTTTIPTSIPTPTTIYNNIKPEIIYSKTFIINSINRDWINNPNRNNLKIFHPKNLNNNKFFSKCLCLNKNIQYLTPYIILNITDNIKTYQCTFICDKSNLKWDIWKPVNDNCINIDLNNNIWYIKLFDFDNNELLLGNDNIPILEVLFINDNKELKLKIKDISNLKINDLLIIKLKNNTFINVNILKINYDENCFIINNNNYKLDDFINSTFLNSSEQFSLIISYDL